MEHIVLRNLDNAEIWDSIVDKRFDYILLNQFNPHSAIEWWPTSIKLTEDFDLERVLARDMHFDLFINLKILQQILTLNNSYLYIYQFNKPVPDTLVINNLDNLNEVAKENILQKNGLQHIISIEFENTLVSSFDSEYIKLLRENEMVRDKIINATS